MKYSILRDMSHQSKTGRQLERILTRIAKVTVRPPEDDGTSAKVTARLRR
jgi:hypothetical protein